MLTRRDALRLAAAAAPFAVSPAEAAAPLDGPVPFVPDARPPTDPPPSHLMQGGLILFAEGEDGERTSGHVTFFAEVAGDDWAVEMRTSDRIMGEPERLPPCCWTPAPARPPPTCSAGWPATPSPPRSPTPSSRNLPGRRRPPRTDRPARQPAGACEDAAPARPARSSQEEPAMLAPRHTTYTRKPAPPRGGEEPGRLAYSVAEAAGL